MESDNLRRNPHLAYYVDGTKDSLEYKLLQSNVLQRAMSYQNFVNHVCKAHTDYSSSELSEAKQECVNRTLDALQSIIKNVENYYDHLYHSKNNTRSFVDYLQTVDKEQEKARLSKENREMRFGKDSFFDKYRTYMH